VNTEHILISSSLMDRTLFVNYLHIVCETVQRCWLKVIGWCVETLRITMWKLSVRVEIWLSLSLAQLTRWSKECGKFFQCGPSAARAIVAFWWNDSCKYASDCSSFCHFSVQNVFIIVQNTVQIFVNWQSSVVDYRYYSSCG